MHPVAIRPVTSPSELARLPKLEQAVWGNDDPVPPSLLRVLIMYGGEVAVAFNPAQPDLWLGFSMAFQTRDASGPFLYSHQTGVVPSHQGQGIGRGLKYHQNRWAEQHGFTRICWTFDPLRAANAHFNVGILGAEVTAYYPDYYGQLSSRINHGLPTDRLLATWRVPAPMPRRIPRRVCLRIHIPQDLDRLKEGDPGHALRWQETVRQQFTEALESGYRVVGFEPGPKPAYLLANSGGV